MQYHTLGRTGLRVSQLGFGAMRLPMVGEGADARVNRELAIPMIHRAFELGVTYMDTAIMYCNNDSQRAVGEALKGWRDKIVLSTKNHYYGTDEKEWWTNLEDSLERLGVDYIDIYNHHGLNAKALEEHIFPVMGEWMRKAKDQGLIKHICCSFHDNNEGLMKIADSGYPSVITLQYNLLDRSCEEGLAYAHERGIGIVVMGPVGGGRLGEPSEVLESLADGIKRVPELALRFVLSNPSVDVALSGMSTMAHVIENAHVCSDPVTLSEADKTAIHEHLVRLRKMADLYCTGCRYCMPCPSDVDIPGVFDRYNKGRVFGLWEHAKGSYNHLVKSHDGKDHSAAACTECGACEDKCPQHIPIRKQLKEAHKALSSGK